MLEAPDGAAALRAMEANGEVDLLFTDVALPGELDGPQLADAARKRSLTHRVLFTTGYARNALTPDDANEGGVDLIVKPFTFDRLAAKLRGMFATEREHP